MRQLRATLTQNAYGLRVRTAGVPVHPGQHACLAYGHLEQGDKTYARSLALMYDGPGLITQRVAKPKTVRTWPVGQRGWGELRVKAFEHATTDETRWGVTRISGDHELKTPRGATIGS